jgi:dihydrofolate reductase
VIISLIVAMDRNRLIGNKNQLPWHLPADLAHFKQVTMGKPIIMGRKTYESIGRPLPGRTNIVLTRDEGYQADGIVLTGSLENALDLAASEGAEEVMIIGGSNIYAQALDHSGRLYLTLVDAEYEGDAWFPEIDMEKWQQVSTEAHSADEKNPVDYRFMIFEKK